MIITLSAVSLNHETGTPCHLESSKWPELKSKQKKKEKLEQKIEKIGAFLELNSGPLAP